MDHPPRVVSAGAVGVGAQAPDPLDRYCAALGRDPSAIVRSFNVPVSYEDAPSTSAAVADAAAAGFTHLILSLRAPFPVGVAQWLVDEVIAPSL